MSTCDGGGGRCSKKAVNPHNVRFSFFFCTVRPIDFCVVWRDKLLSKYPPSSELNPSWVSETKYSLLQYIKKNFFINNYRYNPRKEQPIELRKVLCMR